MFMLDSPFLRIQREFVEMMDAHLAARALELLDQRRREKLRQRAAHGIGAADAAQPLHLRIPAFDSVVETGRENADIDRFDDVLAEFLQPLILVHFLFERAVEIGVFGGDPDVIRERLQQFDVVARKKLARLRAAHAEERDGPAAHRAGQIVVEIEIGDGLANRGGPASGNGIEMIAGAFEEDVRARVLRPVEKTQVERLGRVQRARARAQGHAQAPAANRQSASRSSVRRLARPERKPHAGSTASASAGRPPTAACGRDRFPNSARARIRSESGGNRSGRGRSTGRAAPESSYGAAGTGTWRSA